MIIFIVARPGAPIENVIVGARDREDAKTLAHAILSGNKEEYIVDPITQNGSRTVFLIPGS